MERFSNILRLLRIKHYVKNILVFVPLAFTGDFYSFPWLTNCIWGFVVFCLLTSTVYIINDIKDIESDRKHPIKKNRPLASGVLKPKDAYILATICLLGSITASAYICTCQNISYTSLICLLMYLMANISYSLGLKNIPIIDIVILMSGFLIRIIYGAIIGGTYVSSWLLLTVITGAFYFGLGKRRNELRESASSGGGQIRKVLSAYNINFLDKFMYLCLAMAIIFYALWAKEYPKEEVIWTVPLVILICMQYSFDIETNADGDPVEVIFRDKKILLLLFALGIALFSILYLL